LPQNDALEVLARQCLMRHGDGRLWGFRALVPGVKVADCPAPVELNPVKLDAPSPEDAYEDEDTVEREAVRLNRTPDVPDTPVPEIERSEEEEVKQEEALAHHESEEVEEVEQENLPDQQERQQTEVREGEQEELPAREAGEEQEAP